MSHLLEKPVAILGAGACGQTFAADFLLAGGYQIRLYEFPEFAKESLGEVIQTHEIELGGSQANFKWLKREGTARVDLITTDISEALNGAGLIIVPVPAKAHKPLFEKMIPFLEDEQIISIFPDNFGTLLLSQMMREKGCNADVVIGGWSSMPYGVRKVGPGKLNLLLRGYSLAYDTLPSRDVERFYDAHKGIPPFDATPVLRKGDTVIGIGLSNPNTIVHTPTSILSVGPMEVSQMEEGVLGIPKGEFSIYVHAMSPAVARVQFAFYQETVRIANAIGVKVDEYREYDFFRKSSIVAEEFLIPFWDVIVPSAPGPDSTEHRYFTEDIPVGDVVYYNLAKKFGVEVPVIDAVIRLGSIMCGRDFYSEGRSLAELGLEDLETEDLVHYVREGVRP
jgi:opine dehydrogenase